MLSIRQAGEADIDLTTEFFMRLWPEHEYNELREEIAGIIGEENAAIYLAYLNRRPAGAAQCSIRRDYVEGTSGGPVGYLEGIYVLPDYRRKGVAGSLLRCCENWAKARGCKEFASDCALDNQESYGFHVGVGFAEVNRIICFVKELRDEKDDRDDEGFIYVPPAFLREETQAEETPPPEKKAAVETVKIRIADADEDDPEEE